MGTSILFSSTSDSREFRYTEETSRINFVDGYLRFNGARPQPVNEEELFLEQPDAMFFLSEKKKVFITLMNGPYHFFIDSLGPFLQQYEQTPDATFIFDTSNIFDPDKPYFDFFLHALRKKGIDFRVIKAQGMTIYAKNFYLQKYLDDSYDAPNRLYKFYSDFIKDPKVKPFRKVYVSRSFMPKRPLNIVPGASFNHDDRIDDEQKLENFFRSIGFEIIVPEKDFTSFEDQLNIFYETKTLVSLTSGGITNSSWMQPGGTVIELINSMVTPMGGTNGPGKENGLDHVEEALHHFYVTMAWRKSHNYIGIDNKKRSADVIIDKIKKSEFLKTALGA